MNVLKNRRKLIMPQLKMLFNANKNALPELEIAEGFYIDTVKDSDLEQYNELRKSVNFPEWTAEYLQTFRNKVLNDAMFVIKEKTTGKFCAAATAETTDMKEYPEIKAALVQVTRQSLEDSYDLKEVISKIKECNFIFM